MVYTIILYNHELIYYLNKNVKIHLNSERVISYSYTKDVLNLAYFKPTEINLSNEIVKSYYNLLNFF